MHVRSVLAAGVIFSCYAPITGASGTPTPHRTTGTHYKPVTAQRVDVSKGLSVRGRILAAPDCKAVPSAKVSHWQAGEDGRYADRLRAYLFADSEGRFSFETEWPAISPPHIHFMVTAEGYEILETQWIGDNPTRDIAFDMVLRPAASK
jgi:protocatechuate 3,4-dioxygenase beta subunit